MEWLSEQYGYYKRRERKKERKREKEREREERREGRRKGERKRERKEEMEGGREEGESVRGLLFSVEHSRKNPLNEMTFEQRSEGNKRAGPVKERGGRKVLEVAGCSALSRDGGTPRWLECGEWGCARQRGGRGAHGGGPGRHET